MKKIVLIVVFLMAMNLSAHGEENVKPAGLAGSWYPADKKELSTMIDGFFAGAKDVLADQDIGVIVSPHAGFVFSGNVAAYGFKAAQSRKISTVVILAPTHHVSFEGASVWADGAFATPLGRVEIDKDLAGKILAFDKRFSFRKDVFEGAPGRAENSVETQIPFIQKAFPQAKIVPIILGYPPDGEMLKVVANALASLVGNRSDVLVDVSVDQSHFHPDADARVIDAKGLAAIEAMDIQKFLDGHNAGEMEVDGFHVVTTAMLYAKSVGYTKAKVIKYGTSADATGDKGRVVGYASIMFYRDKSVEKPAGVSPLTAEQKARLLKVARDTAEAFVKTGKAPEVSEADPRFNEEEGAFVTLHKNGQLRGCIGNIIGSGPLIQTVRAMAIASSSQDHRFDPVSVDELKDIDVEISVLSKPRVIKSPDEIIMGTHGVIVSRGLMNRGVFLPQVATETKWSKEEFLAQLCAQKAGLPPLAWKDPATTLEVFTAEVFGEKEK